MAAGHTSADDALMPLAEIEKTLTEHPPALHTDSPAANQFWRLPAINGLEGWLKDPHTTYWTKKPEESNPEFFAYYLKRMITLLDEVESQTVTKGAVVWKLYSSGFLVTTPDTVFAVDAVEGPFKHIDRSPADEPDYIFKWTPEMRKRFAKVVDVMFITHQHYDHTSFALVSEMVAAGKTVVVPNDLKVRNWKSRPFVDKLTTMKEDVTNKVGKLDVRVFIAVQSMQRNEANEYYVKDTDPDHNVYLIRTPGGLTFLHNGDNRGINFIPWLREQVADDWNPDIWFKIITWPRKIISEVNAIASPLMIPGHEYEMGHKPKYGTNKLSNFFRGINGQFIKDGKMVVITWGEQIAVDKR
jgi:hypothetical protein